MENKIIKEYINGKSILKISKENNIKYKIIRKILLKNNINILSNKDRYKLHFNENFFKEINSEESAYFLGLIAADGQIQNKKQSSKLFRIDLEYTDCYLIERLTFLLGLNTDRIKYYYNNYNTHYGRLCIPSDNLCNDLYSFGIIPNKSFLLKWNKFNNIPKKFLHHFIRGFFDGNGCITTPSCVKICSTEEFLLGMQDYLIKELLLNKTKLHTRHKERNNNIRSLEYGGKNQVEKIMNFLYKNSTIFMKRKYDKFKKILH